MAEKLAGKVLVAQGGGPTAVINQSLAGVVLEARRFPHISRVYGALHGVTGIVDEQFIDLTRETTHNLELVAATPGSALLSTRVKPDEEYCNRMFEVLRRHGIHYFFYIGGNDSSDTLRIVNACADAAGYPLRCVHIPKTVDNDLMENDHTPGYGSAARFVSSAFQGINLDNLALKGVYIGVIMGRHAGFLTASSALARKYPDEGPHLIYLPERVFDEERFLADVDATMARHGRCIVAVSEGIHDAQGKTITERLKHTGVDDHGNVQLSGTSVLGEQLMDLVKTRLHFSRVRADTFGYLQRSFAGCVSDRDAREAREVGEKAVHHAIWDDVDGSVAIRRPVLDYGVDFELVPLDAVAGKTKTMADAFINDTGNHVTEEFHRYCRPLIGASAPRHYRLRAPKVAEE